MASKPIDSRPGGFDWAFYPGAPASVALSRCPASWAAAALVVNVASTPSGAVVQTGTATPHEVGDGTVTLSLELDAVVTEALGAGSFYLELLVDTLPTIVVSLLGSYTAAQPRNPLAVSVNPRGQATVVEVVPTGPVGPGVPSGGATGRVLAKASSTDYDTEWIDPASQAELDAHLNDTAAAHAASAISATPAGGLTGDTVAAQLAELDTEKATVGSVSAIEAELGVNPSGGEATVAARFTAIEEDVAASAGLAAHEADTTNVHGIADTSTLYRSGGTDVAVADGGTGASNAAGARTNLGIVAASDTAAGIVELATSIEAVTGTDTGRAVTPAGVAAALAAFGVDAAVAIEMAVPRKWVKVYRVNASTPSGTQTGSLNYTTISAAITACNNDNAFGKGYDNGPETRRLILVDPGTYTEQVNIPHFVDIVGSSGNRADVTINYTGAGATISCGGITTYLAHLTVTQGGTSSGGGIYPLHDDALPGANGNTPFAPQSLVVYDCSLTSNNPNRTSAMGIGMPGRSNYLFVNCTFNSYPTPSTGGPTLILHNTAAQRFSAAAVFVNCIADAKGSTTPLVVTDLGSGQPDRISWVGGSAITTGSNQVSLTNSAGSTLQLALDPTVFTTAVTGATTASAVTYTKSLASVGIGGNTKDIDSFYYPSRIRQSLVLTPQCDISGFSTLTPDRVYYIPVEITAAVNVKDVLASVSTIGGGFATGLYYDDGTGRPANYMTRSPGRTTVAAGLNTSPGLFTRTVYPGTGVIWIGIATESATATYLASNYFSTMRTLYYETLSGGWSQLPTSATPVALAAGTVVPVASLLTSTS